MEKWIILKTQDIKTLVPKNPITDVEDIAECDWDGVLMLFNSLNEASAYQEENAINGQCIELPLY